VVLLAVPPVAELDLVGPAAVFACATRAAAREMPGYRVTLASAARRRAIDGHSGLQLLSHTHYSGIRGPIDTLLVAGGGGAMTSEPDRRLCDWLRRASVKARRVGSVCTGAYVLAAAGLLDGKRVATHWAHASALAERYPGVHVDADPIWIKDGKTYTSAGVTAGIDLALALVEEDRGSIVALEIARELVVFLKRPAGQRQFSVALRGQTPTTRSFAGMRAWIADHLGKPLSVETLARHMAMSPRNFARVFRAELGVTPARYVRAARLEAERIQLEQTRRGLEDIAQRCGFESDEVMRRAFVQELSVTLGQYRSHFETVRS
jgi:transcriptional regulator GlxA family with amidase domain